MRLFVLNTVEEFVSNVSFLPIPGSVEGNGLKESRKSESSSGNAATGEPVVRSSDSSIGSDIVKAVNFSYVRDLAILGPGYRQEYLLQAETEADRGKFMGFLSYLQNRQKSAIIRLENAAGQVKEVLYAYPPEVGVSVSHLRCYVKLPSNPTLAVSTATPKESNVPLSQPPTLSAPSQVKPKQTIKTESNDFLGSLLGKVESKAAIRAVGSCVNPAAKLAQELEEMEAAARTRLAAFRAQTELTSIEFPPMEKNMRYVIHEVVEAFPELVSASVGDDEERHVVVYKKGFEPADLELHGVRHDGMVYPSSSVIVPGGGGIGQGTGSSRPAASRQHHQQQQPHAAPAVAQNLIKIEAVKRDRRSIEEIQRDMKRRKEEVISAETSENSNR